MRLRTKTILAVAVLTVWRLPASNASNGSDLIERHLASLKKISLYVTMLRFDSRDASELEGAIRRATVKSLEDAGLIVTDKNTETLSVKTYIQPISRGAWSGYALSSWAELRERVTLVRDDSVAPPEGYATTWRERSHIDFAEETNLAAVAKAQALDLVYSFTEDRRMAIAYSK
jgi:hypothetical protein